MHCRGTTLVCGGQADFPTRPAGESLCNGLWLCLRSYRYALLYGASMVAQHKETACSAGEEDSVPGLGRPPGGGHGNPLQYYCLENSMDRGAWWATVYRFVKSQTQVKQLSTQASFMLHVVGRRSKTLNPQWISSITSLQSCPEREKAHK